MNTSTIFNKHNFCYLIEIIVLYFILLFLEYITTNNFSKLWQGRILSVAILLSLGRIFFTNKKNYYINLLGQGLLLGSTIFIKFLLNEPINMTTFCTQLGYTIGLLNLLFIINRLLYRKVLTKCFNILIYLLVFLPTVLIWGYYFTTKTYINVDAILAILQTNYNESLEYLTTFVGLPTVVVTLLLVLLISILPQLSFSKLKLNSSSKAIKALFVIFVIGNIILIYKSRINIISSPFYEAHRFTDTYTRFAKNKEYRKASINITSKPVKGIYVVIIGESHSRNFTSAYGYPQDTTPWLREISKNNNTVLFPNAFSCHVQTVPCVTYAMTAKNQYNKLQLENSLTLPEVAEAAGFETVWMSNQSKFGLNDTPITAIADEANQQIWLNGDRLKSEATSLDGELLPRLSEVKLQDNMLIFIHLMGSHVAYSKRYPTNFDIFGHDTPATDYANALRYTDYVVQNIYEYFSRLDQFQGLVYFSDHGEVPGIGHNVSHYEHAMTHIPFFIIFSPSYIENNTAIFEEVQNSTNKNFTNDLIYNNILSIMNIKLKDGYEANNDLLSEHYNNDFKRFRTLHGRKSLEIQ